MTTAKTQGIHHAGLTVPNLADAKRFFEEALGFHVVGEKPEYPAAFVSDGTVMITLWQAEEPDSATPFDRRRGIGLHHIAFQIAEGETLDGLCQMLSKRSDVTVEFEPEALGGSATHHLMIRIPGNIRVELIAPAKH